MKYEYPVVIRKDDNGTYWAEFPDLNGCFSQGSSYEETVKNAKEALQLFLFPPCIFELTVKPKASRLEDAKEKYKGCFVILVSAEN